MADFLHCNRCLRMGLTDNSVKYYLSECEKVFCKPCVDNGIKDCDKCVSGLCRTIPLDASTNHEIQICFKSVTHGFGRLQRVEDFQQKQRQELIRKLMDTNKQSSELCERQKQLNQNLENELKTLKTELESRAKTTTPFSSIFSTTSGVKQNFVNDLFRSEAKKRTIDGFTPQININPMNRLNTSAWSQYKTPNPLSQSKCSAKVNTCSTVSRQPSSQTYLASNSKISLRSNPSQVSQLSRKHGLNGLELKLSTPLTSGRHSTPSPMLGPTPVQRFKSAKRTPSTDNSSIMSLSALYRKTYCRK